MKKTVDLNADVGEGFGPYRLGNDEELMQYTTSVNIACGMHAGDPDIMKKTVAAAISHGNSVGAHPGYPDPQGFGRRDMAMSPEELKSCVIYQVGALMAFCQAAGIKLAHVKPHGAMYNMAAKNPQAAYAIAEAVKAVNPGLVLVGLAGSELIRAGRAAGLRCASEVFADRAYNRDGTLVGRGLPGSMIHAPHTAVARTVRMVTEGRVEAAGGEDIPLTADSICVHGDNPAAIEFAKLIRAALTAAGVEVRPFQ